MAAVVVIMLYMEIPRIAFDAQRTRERLLIEHGEEYKRAIQMFYVKNKRYPSKIEELESLNNQRYLRRRYIDPMTGKDEWRVIHVANGVLTDSLVTKPPTPPGGGDQSNVSNFQYGVSTAGGDLNAGQQGNATVGLAGATVANRKRASDNQGPGLGGTDGQQPADPNNPQQNQGQPGSPGYMGGMPQQPGMVNGQPVPLPPGMSLPGQVPTQGQYPGQTGQYPAQAGQYPPPTGYPGQATQYPGQAGQDPNQVGQPGNYPMPIQPTPGGSQYPGQPVNSQMGGVSPQYGTNPGANGVPPGFQQPGNPVNGQMPGGVNQAQQMIQQILTSPRPGGMPGVPGQALTMGGAGMAGVASNADATGIMSYNDRTNYKEWEFIFDPMKMKPLPNPLSGGAGTPAAQLGSAGGVGGVGGVGGGAAGSPTGDSGSGNSGSSFGGGGYGGYGGSSVTPLTTAPPTSSSSGPPTGPTRFVTDIGLVPVAPASPPKQ
jgi:hypothetical protein